MSSSAPLSAEDAVQKARMIAARLANPNAVVPTAATPPDAAADASHKRKRWGVMPETENDDINSTRPRLATWLATHAPTAVTPAVVEAPVTRRVWVAGVTADKPAAHFVAFATEKLAEISNEHNGPSSTSDHDAATRDEKDADPNRLEIQFQGKGAVSDAPPLPGMPEEPLHVAVTGPKAVVDRVVSRVDEVLTQAAAAETDQAAVAAAAAAREQALVLLTTSAAASLQSHSYRPASVSAMIGNVTAVSNLPADRLAAALLHGTNGAGMGGAVTEEVHVPNSVVGCIIGRGGETIASLQASTGCKVQIQKEHEIQPGQIDRIITLSASSSAAVAECRRIIEDMVQERSKPLPSASNKQMNETMTAVQNGHKLLEMIVPDADVGLIIGKMGSTIQQIQDQTGASIQVPRTGNEEDPAFRTLSITHPNEQGAEHAKQLIENVLKSKPSFSTQPGANGASNASVTIQISIPDKDVGLCIGRGGCVIKHMQQVSQCRIQIPPSALPGETCRVATIAGPQEGCNQVQQMIARIVAEQSSASIMSGAPFSNDYQNARPMHQTYAAPQQNQQGYSAEWAAYHAAQAAAAAAQQEQQQQQQHQQQEAAAASAATGSTEEYREQFFRYAYYYGEAAARQYYGAWSPPEGTPNPYGVNPAGIAPAPAPAGTESQTTVATSSSNVAAAEAAPTQSTGASGPVPEVRETSRRQVSNLPAWMTKK